MPSRLWRFRLQDILEAIARIQSYTRGLTFDQFQLDRKTIDAVERNFILIGEAARHVPDGVTARYPAVPWRNMRDMRNVVVHGYWGVDLERVWDAIQEDLPPLVPLLRQVLEQERED
jgi:uncharacterized protein with HEPN domain